MRLRGASGRSNPGANVYLEGTVPAGAVVPAHGSHLHTQATRVRQIPTAEAASLFETHTPPDKGATLANLTKPERRHEAQARRLRIHQAIGASAAIALRDNGLKLLSQHEGGPISGYWPIRSEPDLRPLLDALSAMGREIALPAVVAPGQALRFHRWRPGDALVPGPLGTATPHPDRPSCVPEIMLVPLLAFDRDRRRLGYGGGFYDRTIASLRAAGRALFTIGIAYAALEVAEIPTDPWDQSLDAILTEQGWF